MLAPYRLPCPPPPNVLPRALRRPVLLAALVAFVVAMGIALVAHAQGTMMASTVPATNTELALYAVIGAQVLAMFASVLREDNNLVKYAPKIVTRFLLVVVVGGIGQTCLLAIATGTPWSKALIAAIGSVSVAWAKDGTRVPPGLTVAEAKISKSGAPPPMASPPPNVAPPAAPSTPGVSS